MTKLHIALRDVGPNGQDVAVDDPSVWFAPCAEFHLPVRVVEPLRASLFLLPQEHGCLVRGSITGRISLDCDRCADPALFTVDQRFDEFEPYPGSPRAESEAAEDDALPETSWIFQGKSGFFLDLGALLWEEFVLSLPTKPLCSPDCKGICPHCGTNFNRGTCDCAREEADPRLASLRAFAGKSALKGDEIF